jgi:hypothetical protein
MAEGMVKHMAHINQENLKGTAREAMVYESDVKEGDGWRAILGDSIASAIRSNCLA